MTDDYFAIRTRFKMVKGGWRRMADPGPASPAFLEASQFLQDLVAELARIHPSGVAVGRRKALECLAEAFRPELTAILHPPQPAAPRPRDFTVWPARRFPVQEGDLRRGDWHEQSALKLLGYTVGATKGWAQQDRQDFLRYFMEAQLPLRVAEVFGNAYGTPLSDMRLAKVVALLKSAIQRSLRNDPDRYAVAIEHWSDDLTFLRQVYGSGRPWLSVAWPASRTG